MAQEWLKWLTTNKDHHGKTTHKVRMRNYQQRMKQNSQPTAITTATTTAAWQRDM
jgi:hypothetical protein